MRAAFFAAGIVPVAAFIPDATYDFRAYIQEFDRSYKVGSQDYDLRKAIFDSHLRSIVLHNSNSSKTWKRGVNEYTDMSQTEFEASGRLGYVKGMSAQYAASFPERDRVSAASADAETLEGLPSSVDWRSKGVISDVKDQGHCGSCWAFATTETIESYAAIESGTLLTLSPQQLAGCAPNPLDCGGVGGCQGSIPEVAFDYVQLYGMTTEWMLPYTAYHGDTGTCGFNRTTTPSSVKITGYTKLPSNDYAAVMKHLATVGPLAINVDASSWHDYEGGIYDGCNHTNSDIDHVVQLVGYGSDQKGGDYWLVRNSWDATWGEKGYIRLKRSAKPACAVDSSPLDGTGCKGGAPTQTVCGTCGVLWDPSYPLGAAVTVHGHHTSIVV